MALETEGKVVAGAAMAAEITHIGLLTAANAEPVGNGYARIAVTWNTPDPVTGVITNDGALISAIASGSWGTLTQWGGYNAASAGDLLIKGALDDALGISAGDFVRLTDELLEITPS